MGNERLLTIRDTSEWRHRSTSSCGKHWANDYGFSAYYERSKNLKLVPFHTERKMYATGKDVQNPLVKKVIKVIMTK